MNGLVAAVRLVARVPKDIAPDRAQAESRARFFAHMAAGMAFPEIKGVKELPAEFLVAIEERETRP